MTTKIERKGREGRMMDRWRDAKQCVLGTIRDEGKKGKDEKKERKSKKERKIERKKERKKGRKTN